MSFREDLEKIIKVNSREDENGLNSKEQELVMRIKVELQTWASKQTEKTKHERHVIAFKLDSDFNYDIDKVKKYFKEVEGIEIITMCKKSVPRLRDFSKRFAVLFISFKL